MKISVWYTETAGSYSVGEEGRFGISKYFPEIIVDSVFYSFTLCLHRHGEWTEGIGGSMLLQAVRSYLYFSQLSSWLSSMQGHLPVVTVCR